MLPGSGKAKGRDCIVLYIIGNIIVIIIIIIIIIIISSRALSFT